MARYGRLGQKTPGADPDYISSYETRTSPVKDLTQYGDWADIDLEKSARLRELKQKYGPALDNKIIGENMRLYGQAANSFTPSMYQSPSGHGMTADAQDIVLTELRNRGLAEQREAESKKRWQLRTAHQTSKNPMLF